MGENENNNELKIEMEIDNDNDVTVKSPLGSSEEGRQERILKIPQECQKQFLEVPMREREGKGGREGIRSWISDEGSLEF
jgi:hypothetical protein